MIRITKIGRAYMVEATAPHTERRWKNLLPVSARGVIEGLIRHGASLPAACAALAAADPYGVDHAFG